MLVWGEPRWCFLSYRNEWMEWHKRKWHKRPCRKSYNLKMTAICHLTVPALLIGGWIFLTKMAISQMWNRSDSAYEAFGFFFFHLFFPSLSLFLVPFATGQGKMNPLYLFACRGECTYMWRAFSCCCSFYWHFIFAKGSSEILKGNSFQPCWM